MLAEWEDLCAVVRQLRGPEGCPWDRVQTHASLRRYALEEAREVVGAIDAGRMDALAEELGDLLLQVLLHAVIAEEEGAFGPDDVVVALTDKLIRRHPHVFGEASAKTPEQVVEQWAVIKAGERSGTGAKPATGFLDAVARDLSALGEAQELGRRASQVGFDWGAVGEAWPKVAEEAAEFESAWRRGEKDAAETELGDLLFAVVNAARLAGIDAELALGRANAKFRRRFAAIEAVAQRSGRELGALGLDEMEAAWQAAKQHEPERP